MEVYKGRKWWTDYQIYIFGAFNLIFPITQFIFVLFETTSMKKRIIYVAILLLLSFLASLICGFFYGKNKKNKNNRKREFKFNQTHIVVEYGDIFKEKGIILIPMDSDFDTDCNSKRIPEKSIQSIFVNKVKKSGSFNELSGNIKNYLNQNYDDRLLGMRYDSGIEKYLLFPVVNLDNKDVAKMEFVDYIIMVVTLCEAINTNAKKNAVILPIVGSGVAILNSNINSFNKLQILLRIMEIYNFNREVKIKIIVHEKHKLDFKLSEL